MKVEKQNVKREKAYVIMEDHPTLFFGFGTYRGYLSLLFICADNIALLCIKTRSKERRKHLYLMQ